MIRHVTIAHDFWVHTQKVSRTIQAPSRSLLPERIGSSHIQYYCTLPRNLPDASIQSHITDFCAYRNSRTYLSSFVVFLSPINISWWSIIRANVLRMRYKWLVFGERLYRARQASGKKKWPSAGLFCFQVTTPLLIIPVFRLMVVSSWYLMQLMHYIQPLCKCLSQWRAVKTPFMGLKPVKKIWMYQIHPSL